MGWMMTAGILRLSAVPDFCIVDDGDPFDPGMDLTPGFELGVYGGPDNPATCTLTISD